MIPIPSNPTKWLKNRTLPLLAALLACIGLYPIFMLKPGMSENLFQAVVICIPLFGLFALTHWKRAIPLVGLFLVMIIWSWLSFGFDQTRVARSPISYLACLYYIYAIVVLASELLKNESLIDDRVYGGIVIYLLAAMMFSSLHRHVSAVDPNAYYQTFDEKPLLMLWKESLYYSVSAITTLGFGDIIPVSNWARAVTILEAISGIFITIVFIARLASLPTKHAKHS